MKSKIQIERTHILRARFYLIISFISFLTLNLLIHKFYDTRLLEPPLKYLGYWGVIISLFFLFISGFTAFYSLRKSHIELFTNIKNDSLTYLFILLLILIYFYKQYIFGVENLLLFVIVVCFILKLALFTGMFFKKKYKTKKADLAVILVLLTVIGLSLLSRKGIDLNKRLIE
ncbi:hypothetical protein KKB18_01035, partial [bacterium]|nr:hypothetical protein [bacterium]